MKNSVFALAGVLALAGCATAPSATTVVDVNAAVSSANVIALQYEGMPSTTAAQKAKAVKAVTALDSAWAAYQASLADGTTPNVAAVNAAVQVVLVASGE